MTVNNYAYWLQEQQKSLFKILIEGEQIPFFNAQNDQQKQMLFQNDPFNHFNAFMRMNPFSSNLLTMNGPNKLDRTEISYKGLILDMNQVKRLAFHALKHPEQYVKETIAESIDLLLSSFKDQVKT